MSYSDLNHAPFSITDYKLTQFTSNVVVVEVVELESVINRKTLDFM